MNPAEYPSTRRDWEALQGQDYSISPNFRHHTADYPINDDDWPIDYALLDPYFAENDRNIGVAGLAGDPVYPPHDPPLPHVPMGRMGEKEFKARAGGARPGP